MAAWGSLLNIFENPLSSDSLSSWSQLLPKADADTSFDMFGDLCHRVNPEHEAVRSPRFDKSFSWNTTMSEPDNNAFEIFGELFYKSNPEHETDSCPGDAKPGTSAGLLERCTEDLGAEDGAADGNGHEEKAEGERNRTKRMHYRRSYSDVRPRCSNGGLMIPPPPITSIGKGGKPRVYFKSYRKDGRFVLREIRIPTQQLLQSRRENGRLRMQVAVTDGEGDHNVSGGEGNLEEEEER